MLKFLIRVVFVYVISLPVVFSAGLHDAIRAGDVEKVKQLLELGADIESTDDGLSDRTPLSVAVREASDFDMLVKGNEQKLKNLMEIVELLISSGAKIDRKLTGFDKQDPVLHDAVFGYNATLVKMLLDSGASVKSRTAIMGDYPIISAIDTGGFATSIASAARYASSEEDKAQIATEMLVWPATRKPMVLLLIQYGANINVKDKSFASNESPLHKAVDFGMEDVVRLLVEYGAKTNIKDYDGNTPLYVAINKSEPDEEVIEILKNAEQIYAEKKALIKEAQKYLKMTGHYQSTIDGIYGKNTAAAVRKYQNENGLDEDGDINKDLILHISNNLEKNSSAISE